MLDSMGQLFGPIRGGLGLFRDHRRIHFSAPITGTVAACRFIGHGRLISMAP